MKICKSLGEIMDYLNCSGYEVYRAWQFSVGESKMYIQDKIIIKSYQKDQLLFIIKDLNA